MQKSRGSKKNSMPGSVRCAAVWRLRRPTADNLHTGAGRVRHRDHHNHNDDYYRVGDHDYDHRYYHKQDHCQTTTTTTATTTKTTTTTVTTTTTTARAEVTVTIPEGYTFMEIARLLEQKGVCSVADFYAVCQSYTPQSFTIPISEDRCFRMEGYLFPDTYRFYVNDDPQTVLIRMLNNYRAKVGDLSDDTLILASIIECEARSDKHMKLVSSVFHNRLDKPSEFLYLNADPTRDYVNEFITGNPLVENQAKYAPLYNTCGKRIGLPAGPICSPGLRAIRAAQEPTPSPYYYFFYGQDFDNHYSETLEEHEQKMQEIGVG